MSVSLAEGVNIWMRQAGRADVNRFDVVSVELRITRTGLVRALSCSRALGIGASFPPGRS